MAERMIELMGEVQHLHAEVSRMSNDFYVRTLVAELTDIDLEFWKISEALHVQKYEHRRLHQMKRQTQRRIAAQEEYLEHNLAEARNGLATAGGDAPDLKSTLKDFLDFFAEH